MKPLADPADRLAAILRRAGIRVVADTTIDCPGQVAIEQGSYVIRIRPNLPASHRLTVLQHELAHVLHGDLIAMQREHREPTRWNLATDQRINATLDPVVVAELNGVTPASLREHGMLARDLGEPRPAWSARSVYDAIVIPGTGADAGGIDSLTTDGTMTESAHAATVVRTRGIARAEGAESLLPDGNGGGGGILQGGDGRARRTWPTPRPEPSPAVAAILARLAAVAGRADRRRTWRRPGRLPELRGSAYEPRLHLLAGLDVSGSTDALLPTLGAVVAWLRRDPRWDVTCAVWADRAQVVTDLAATAATVGYGTQVQSLFAVAATRGVDAVVVATDGVIADWYPAPAMPVVWVVAGGADRRPPYGMVVHAQP
jgi:hypothetical protein